MEKWIILRTLHPDDFKNPIDDISQFAVWEGRDDAALKTFDSLDEAHDFQEEHAINGQCIQLPTLPDYLAG